MNSDETSYDERYTHSTDGLRLYFRDYAPPAGADRLPVICLHGLTRNSRDFAPLADILRKDRRVIAFDFRGRGRSERDPDWRHYHPGRYVQDVWTILDDLAIGEFIPIGTSLGGWMILLMTHERRDAVAAAVLNDIGPRANPGGLARVAAAAGTLEAADSFAEALERTRACYEIAFPDWGEDRWSWYTQTTYREQDTGGFDLDYDRNIGLAVRQGVSGLRTDPWRLYAALADKKTLLLQGELSDILTDDIVQEMRQKKPDLQVVQVPNRGHAPLLDEPEAVHAIVQFIDSI